MSLRAGVLSALVLVPLLLAGCSGARSLASPLSERARLYELRSDSLSRFSEWALEGRLAVRDADDGGSGHLNWRSGTGFNRMDFYGALGRGAWQLTADDGGVLLEMASGETYRADSIDELVLQQVGWDIPVNSLKWWVRGLASPGDWDERELDDRGQLISLVQDGWAIEFANYRQTEGITLPLKISAERRSQRVKLAVRNWEIGGLEGSGE